MNLEMRPATQQERLYAYSQSQQISMQTGLIGHLRGDMGSDGNSFYSTWNDFRSDLKTVEFKTEFDEVINALRFDEQYGGLLKDRNSLARYGRTHPESSFEGNYCTEHGFRIDSEKHTYILRLNPNKGDYNLYCYCYIREMLDRHMKQAQKGIRFINSDYKDGFRLPDGDKIRITASDGKTLDRTCRYIDECHLEVGNNLYHICEFAERMEQAGNTVIPLRSSLPESCYSTLLDTGMIVILKKGETGYYKTDIPYASKEEAREIVDEQNAMAGITKAQAAAMSAGSMFGFDVPAADPANYDKDGQPIKPKHRDRGDAR